ncbi:MAG: ABC transporter permease subunit [Chloroflexi bacterium]|nr:MAG: ABC transporter permease subunit [Chloroflexota bacterium]
MTAGRPKEGGRRFSLDWLGTVPFLAYVAVFLFLPTLIIVAGAFVSADGGVTLGNFSAVTRSFVVRAALNSMLISLVTAVIGAALGAILTYAIALGSPNSVLRRMVTSACGVLAQFGGVTLAFAFLATIGPAGFVYVMLKDHGIDFYGNGYWIYDIRGLEVVYLYFQIPLMVLVFLPAVDGIKPQWREATESLGGNSWHYWRYVAGPLLFPAFLGGTLLLFANSFSAFATANALINQGGIILPQQISNYVSSETGGADAGVAQALAVLMIVIVTLVTVVYSLLQRRTSRWLQ